MTKLEEKTLDLLFEKYTRTTRVAEDEYETTICNVEGFRKELMEVLKLIYLDDRPSFPNVIYKEYQPMSKLEKNTEFVQELQYCCKEGTKSGLLCAINTIKELKEQNITDIDSVLKTLEQVYKTYANENRREEAKWEK